MGHSLDADLRAAYLDRLGLDAEPPSVEALQRLHRRHAERIPYETMWIHAGEAWTVDPIESVARIALHSRGGYCFHLNGAFAELLQSLGYDVARHVGGVHGGSSRDPAAAGNHVVLTVRGLASEANPTGVWYVDVGLGDALHEAMPLVAAEHQQGPFRLVLSESDDVTGGWRLQHDPAGGFSGMEWTAPEVQLAQFAAKHQWLSTSPESGFVRVAMAERRDATGVDVVRGLIVMRIGRGAAAGEPLTNRREWFDALADHFDLRFEGTPDTVLDRLWHRALETHRAWDAAGRP